MALLVLGSCAPGEKPPGEAPVQQPAPAASPVSPPPSPTQSIPLNRSDAGAAPRRPVTEIFRGTGSFLNPAAAGHEGATTVTGDGDISLNFVNADIREVAKAILGDFLKLNYVVDAKTQGTVTIQTSRPLGRAAVLPMLEQALRLNGLAIVKAEETYRVVPLAEAPRQAGASIAGAAQPGFGVALVPLRYISATEMQRLLEPLAPSGGILRVDPTRNLLIIAGSEQERQAMLDDVALFDVDALSGMSFALFTPRALDARELARELGQIVGGRDSPLAGVLRFITIDRLNAVLAISPQAKYLEQLRDWVERLDRPGDTVDQRLYVYRVQNGRAADLAAVLTKVMGASGTPSGLASRVTPPGEGQEVVLERPASPAAAIPGQEPGRAPSAPPATTAPTVVPEAPRADTGGSGIGAARGLNITPDEVNNALVILATPKEYAVIEAALRQLDTVPLQVLLEASVAEVTLTDDLQYGVQYFLQRGHSQIVQTNTTTTSITPSLPAFAYSFASSSNIQVILSALQSVTRVDVLSSPSVLVLNNQSANLQVGDQVPVATGQAVSTVTSGAPIVNSIQYVDTGVILKVTPRVNEGGMVMMDISQEVSDVAPTSSSPISSPTIEQRKIRSTVAVRDGETIALGGLITDSRTRSKNGVPVLQDIPMLGNLFRTTQDQVARTELLVLITPHLVESLEKARSVTSELRRKLPTTEPLFERAR
ncbi:MAG TPA: type II secretion system secretin GspD [Stellaceae bacterium]|nr:type II secretion system secretin GspD [Stellaceae bacterium]